jgi:hypothetical protein
MIYAAVGTLATETDNATDVGLSVNDALLLKGVLNVDDTKLKGAASGYHSEVLSPAMLEKYFVHFFARDCAAIADLTDGEWTTVTTDMIPLADDDEAPGDRDLHGRFSMAVRAYVSPESDHRRCRARVVLNPNAAARTPRARGRSPARAR